MKQYVGLLKDILINGEEHLDRTQVGTRSVFGRQLRFNLQDSFPLVTVKQIPFRWVAEELFWILSGCTNEKVLADKGVDIWKEWSGESGDLGPTYGFQLRNFGADYDGNRLNGYDQIRWLMSEIRENPGSRRLILTYWNPAQLNEGRGVFPPCHVAAQFKVHPGGELSCFLFQRSADVFLGLPFDIASYAILTTLIAKCAGLMVKDLVVSLGDAHVYLNHLKQAEEVAERSPMDPPILGIHSRLFGQGSNGLLSAAYDDLDLIGYQHRGKVEAVVAV